MAELEGIRQDYEHVCAAAYSAGTDEGLLLSVESEIAEVRHRLQRAEAAAAYFS